jgi:hypothetical protein
MDLEAQDFCNWQAISFSGSKTDLLNELEQFRSRAQSYWTKEPEEVSLRTQWFEPWLFNGNPKTDQDAHVWGKYELLYNRLKGETTSKLQEHEYLHSLQHKPVFNLSVDLTSLKRS